MIPGHVLLFALGIGFVAGLRSFTAPSAVSWAVQLGWLNLRGSILGFMGSVSAVAVFSLAALAEYVMDLLPTTPPRIATGPLIVRILTGALCGASLCVAKGQPLPTGALLGGIGAVIGAAAGYQARTRLVSNLKVNDAMIAIPEDLIAIGLALFFVSHP